MFDRRRRIIAALLVLPVWAAVLVYATAGAPAASAGTVTTPTSCTNTAQAGTSALANVVTGAATPASAAVGATVTLSGATFGINVPGTVLLAGYGLGLLSAGVNNIPAEVTVTLKASNTVELSKVLAPISVTGVTTITDPTPANKTSGDETATPLAVSASLPTSTWTVAAGGDVALSLGSSSTKALVGPGGIIAVTFSCQPGTPGPAGCGPAPLTQCTTTVAAAAAPFSTVTVGDGSSTSTSSTSSTSTSTTLAGGSTTTTIAGATSTTAPAPTTTPTPTTAPPATASPVTGTGAYVTTCTNSVTPDKSELSFEVTGTTTSPVAAGGPVSLSGQSWKVTVPASVLQTGMNLVGIKAGDTLAATATASVFATNTAEGTVTSAPTALSVGPIQVDGAGAALPATSTFAVSDMTWTATGGDVLFSMDKTSVEVAIGPLKVSFTCAPKDPSVSIVTAKVSGTSTTPPAVRGVTVTRADSLPRTGSSTLASVALAVGLIDLGYLLVSAGRPARRRLRHLVQH